MAFDGIDGVLRLQMQPFFLVNALCPVVLLNHYHAEPNES